MTSTTSNIWKRFLFNNQHTIYNKDTIEYHLEYNNNNSLQENNNLENDDDPKIEDIIIHHLDTLIIFAFFISFYLRRYF